MPSVRGSIGLQVLNYEGTKPVPRLVARSAVCRSNCAAGHSCAGRLSACSYRWVVSDASGFSLIEVMVTLAVVAVVMALAVPAFQNSLLNARRDSHVSEFVQALNFARAESVRLRRTVVMCNSDAPLGAIPACGSSQGWESGWIVFVDRQQLGVGVRHVLDPLDADSNRDGELTELDDDLSGDDEVDASDAIFRRREALINAAELGQPAEDRFTLRGNENVDQTIIFDRGGIALSNGSIVACDRRGFDRARIVVVAVGGRIMTLEQGDARVPASVVDCQR